MTVETETTTSFENPAFEALSIEASAEMLRLLVENIRDYAMVTLDTSGRVTRWNPAAQRLKGYQAGEIIGPANGN